MPGAEAAKERLIDNATSAETLHELETEIAMLRDLQARALRLKLSGQNTKRRQLESILDEPMMRVAMSRLRGKVLIFIEPKDTLDHLARGSAISAPWS